MGRKYGKSSYGFSLYSAVEAQSILGAGFANASAFGAGDVRVRIGGTGFVDADAFGHGDLRHLIYGAGFENLSEFGAGTLYPVTIILGLVGFDDAPDEFGLGVLQPFIGGDGAGFADADAFGRGRVVRVTEWLPQEPDDDDVWEPVTSPPDTWQRVPPPVSDWS